MKSKIKKMFVKAKMFVTIVISYIMISTPVYANSIDGLKLFSGSKNLLSVLTGAITAVAAALTTLFALKAGTELQTAQDEEKPRKKKALIETLGIGVVLTCIPALVTWILAFYA